MSFLFEKIWKKNLNTSKQAHATFSFTTLIITFVCPISLTKGTNVHVVQQKCIN